MTQKFLSFGFDTESPYGTFASTIEGKDLRKRQIELVQRINQVFDNHDAPRTFFILGAYLDACLEDNSPSELREIHNKNNPLVEIQQHSFSHLIFRIIKGKEGRHVATPREFGKNLEKANETLERILGVKPNGLRTPLGYHHDLSDMSEILEGLSRLGFRYVSSDLRSERTIFGDVVPERQPHTYGSVGFPNLVEIPSHGWQDTIMIPAKAQNYLGRKPFTFEEMIEVFANLFREANTLLTKRDEKTVYLSLCLHPWAILNYDPNLELQKRVIDMARKEGFEIKTYGQVADSVNPNDN